MRTVNWLCKLSSLNKMRWLVAEGQVKSEGNVHCLYIRKPSVSSGKAVSEMVSLGLKKCNQQTEPTLTRGLATRERTRGH